MGRRIDLRPEFKCPCGRTFRIYAMYQIHMKKMHEDKGDMKK